MMILALLATLAGVLFVLGIWFPRLNLIGLALLCLIWFLALFWVFGNIDAEH